MARFSITEISDRLGTISSLFINTAQTLKARSELQFRLDLAGTKGGLKATFLVAESGCGKTSCVEDFMFEVERAHPKAAKHPVLYVNLPMPCTIKSLTEEMLSKLGDPLSHRQSTASGNTKRIIDRVREQQRRLIVLDEFQHLIDPETNKIQLGAADWLKRLLDLAKTPVVCVGLPNSLQVVDSRRQLNRRSTKIIRLHPFGYDPNDQDAQVSKTFRAFLKFYESQLLFAEASNLHEKSTAAAIHEATGGYIGRISQIIYEAALVSMRRDTGPDAITTSDLEEAFDGLPPDPESEGMRNPFNLLATPTSYGDGPTFTARAGRRQTAST